MSFNFPNNFNVPQLPVSDFNQPGVTFVGASGDNGRPSYSPGAYPDVVDVAATDLTMNNDGSDDDRFQWPDSGGSLVVQQ